MIALDTNVVVDLIQGHETVRSQFAVALGAQTPMVISVFVLQELLTGADLHPRPEQERLALRPILSRLEVMPFEQPDAEVGGTTRALMERAGKRAPLGDFIVGVHALARGHRLVTANPRHFINIPGLTFTNWRSPPDEQEPSHG